jgi:hypothetical protein
VSGGLDGSCRKQSTKAQCKKWFKPLRLYKLTDISSLHLQSATAAVSRSFADPSQLKILATQTSPQPYPGYRARTWSTLKTISPPTGTNVAARSKAWSLGLFWLRRRTTTNGAVCAILECRTAGISRGMAAWWMT